jgi:hypothetical protein
MTDLHPRPPITFRDPAPLSPALVKALAQFLDARGRAIAKVKEERNEA